MAGQTVVVSVLADTKKFSSAMKNLGNETGLSKVGAGFKNAGAKIASFAKVGVASVAAVGTAMGALALKGGFERMMNIENAQAKLKGLGHDARTVTAVMDDALASVKGTAFGLDSAATSAASAIAAGIAPGQELQKYLRGLADAATIAGTSMDEMGAIYGKIATSGRAQTTEINQIADRGIPIWKALADTYGVTQEELRKMVSAGKVDAQTFYDTMDTLVGGAAMEAGNTTQGAFANMKAALSRAGAAVLNDVFPMFKTAFQGITGWLDTLTERAKPMGEALGAWVAKATEAVQVFIAAFSGSSQIGQFEGTLGKINDAGIQVREVFDTIVESVRVFFNALAGKSEVGAFDGHLRTLNDAGIMVRDTVTKLATFFTGTLIPALSKTATWVKDNRELVLTLAAAVTGFVVAMGAIKKVTAIIKAVKVAWVALSAVFTASPIGLLIAAIAALVAGLVWFFTQTKTGQKIISTAWAAIQAAVGAVVEWFNTYVMPVLSAVWDTITTAASASADWFAQHVVPVFQAAGDLLSAVFDVIGAVLTALWENVWSPILGWLLDKWDALWTGVQMIWDKIGPPIIDVVSAGFENLKSVLEGVWNAIKTVIETTLGIIKGVMTAATALLKGDWSGAWDAIKGIAETVWNGIKSTVQNAIGTVKSVMSTTMDTIKSVFSSAWDGVKGVVTGAWDGIKTAVSNGISDVVNFAMGLPGKILSGLGDLSKLLWNAGTQIMTGLWDGLKAKWEGVKSWVGGIGDWIADHKGPKAYDLALLVPAGNWIMQGLQAGLEAQIPALERTLGKVTDNIATTDFGANLGDPFSQAASANHINLTPARTEAPTEAQPMNVYVQNPFTGEYLLSQVADVARSETDTVLATRDRSSAASRTTRASEW